MLAVTIGGAMFLALAVVIRELHGLRERRANRRFRIATQEDLSATQHALQRAREDVYVLQRLLSERRVVTDHELAEARDRLIEAPKMAAQERESIAKALEGAQDSRIVLDGTLNEVH